MNAVSESGIVGLAARYAAQIRELVQVQAIKRQAAEVHAARQEASNARLEELRQTAVQPAKPAQAAPVNRSANSSDQPAPPPTPTSELSRPGDLLDTRV